MKNSQHPKGRISRIMSYVPTILFVGAILAGTYFAIRSSLERVQPACNEGTFRGFPGRAEERDKKITLYAETQGKGPYINGIDLDGDGAYDEIRLRSVPPGHPLESLANRASLDSAHATISGKGVEGFAAWQEAHKDGMRGTVQIDSSEINGGRR